MKKTEIEKIVSTVHDNYVSSLPWKMSKSVSKKKIQQLVGDLDSRGIIVRTVSVPYSKQIVEDPGPRIVDVLINTYKVGPKYPIEIDDDTNIVFLYQWYKHNVMKKDSVLRLKAIKKVMNTND
jgi:hypothetical protein